MKKSTEWLKKPNVNPILTPFFLRQFYHRFKDIVCPAQRLMAQHYYLKRITMPGTDTEPDFSTLEVREKTIERAEAFGAAEEKEHGKSPIRDKQFVFAKLVAKRKDSKYEVATDHKPGEYQGNKVLPTNYQCILIVEEQNWPRINDDWVAPRVWRAGEWKAGIFALGQKITKIDRATPESPVYFISNKNEDWIFRILDMPLKFHAQGDERWVAENKSAKLSIPDNQLHGCKPDWRLEAIKPRKSQLHPQLAYWPYLNDKRLKLKKPCKTS